MKSKGEANLSLGTLNFEFFFLFIFFLETMLLKCGDLIFHILCIYWIRGAGIIEIKFFLKSYFRDLFLYMYFRLNIRFFFFVILRLCRVKIEILDR